MYLDLGFKTSQEIGKRFWDPLASLWVDQTQYEIEDAYAIILLTIHHSIKLYKISQHLLNCYYETQKLSG